MRIQISHDQGDLGRFRIMKIDDVFHTVCPIDLGPVIGDTDVPLAV